MVQKTFSIYGDELMGCDLFIETGNEYIGCWCKDNNLKQVKAFELFSFKKSDAADFGKLFNEIQARSRLLTTSFEKVHCIWGHEKCAMLPLEFYNDGSAIPYLELMFGEKNNTSVCKDVLNDLALISGLPANEVAEYNRHFSVSSNMHKYYQLLSGQYLSGDTEKMHISFYTSHCIISVFKQGKIQLIQSFSFKAPMDVLYHVLNICHACHISVDEIKIYAGGMIDTSSSLYKTLHAYINHFSFEPVTKDLFGADGFHEYPLHYFASFCQYDV